MRQFMCSWSAVLLCLASAAGPAVHAQDYHSPYLIQYSFPVQELLDPDTVAPRDDFRRESKVPYDLWYSPRIRKEFGAWGPVARQYPAIDGFSEKSLAWKRQRVLAVAQKYVGLPYQHHHIPSWDPPPSWPWKPVAFGHNSRGVDCSDFSSWVYNYGLGIKLKTGIVEQAECTDIDGPGGDGQITVSRIHDDSGFDDLVKRLRTGDLLYIRNDAGKIAHVIMWVGAHGEAPDGTPLIIDCTGSDHRDCNGNRIPIGVHFRPFTRDGWYYKSFAHAHRILHEDR